jgi:hypothetical protein
MEIEVSQELDEIYLQARDLGLASNIAEGSGSF